MAVDLESFAASEDTFAVRFERDDLPGLLGKKLTVPDGHTALVRTGEGKDAIVLAAGGESTDAQGGVLVKNKLTIDLDVDAGRSEDNLPFAVSLGLALSPSDKTIDLDQLEQSLLKEDRASNDSVKTFFQPYVEDALKTFVTGRAAEALVEGDQRSDLDAHLRDKLQKALFETGLELKDVVHPRFRSADFEKKVEAEAAASAEVEAIEREREIIEMKKQLDKHALLKDIEVRDEADRSRKEKRLERYEEIRTKMGDDDVKALIMMLDDDKQRSVLIRELIEKDLTADQKANLKAAEMESRVEERLIELQQKLAQLTGAELQPRSDDPITRRVLCVVGKRILAFDPKTNLHPEVPKEVHDTEEGTLGYLRSVRNEVIDGKEFMLAGAQRGVYRIMGEEIFEHPFPTQPQGKGGANSVTYFDGRLFATHSEVGLIEWPIDGSEGRAMCEEALEGVGSVRGAMVVDGRLYFSAGNEIFSLDVATGSETPTRYKGSDDSVTSFTVLRDEVIAGNRAGKTYRWAIDDPNSPESFNVLKSNPIFMLRHTKIAGQNFFLIGSKDFTVTAAEPRKDLYREYQAREEIRWVDGAADYIFGVARSGYKVFCWDAHVQKDPKLTIRVSDKVQDLFVVKMTPS